MKLKKKNILNIFHKVIQEELGFDHVPAEVGNLDRIAFKLSCEQDMELRKQKIQDEIERIKEICENS